ncbi:MAG: HNH endonuclease [Rickettsiales bacterium]|jgi:site-specific DNA-methyltransferase (adenine-specific)|nr:HNH endonuclease [Rickettsiales bacterium]
MKNTLYTNDNLYVMNGMNSQSVDLIYLDPPFNSKRTYSAPIGTKAAGASFKDMWTWKDIDESYLETLADKYPEMATYIASVGSSHSKAMMAYLTYMAQRIIEMYRILKDTGSLFLHCDPTASHYLKQLLDIVFGKQNFMNEIIWYYKNASRGKKKFAKSHDVIFWYSKDNSKYTFYRDDILVPFESGMTEWRYSRGGQAGKEMPKGKTPDDVFVLPSLNAMDKERTGYPTQKPLALLRKIILTATAKGDVVFDPFCGCATACVAAQQLGRKWIGIDIEEQAVKVLIDRLSDDAGLFSDFIATKIPPKRTDVREEPITDKSVKERLYADQDGKCNACGVEMRIVDFEIDHIIPRTKGGGDYYENYQLLCPHCNRTKGDRPMEYLRTKIKHREELLKNKIIFGD